MALGGVGLLCALIAAAAFVAPARVGSLELQREALVAANRLEAQMMKEPDIVVEALMHPGLAPQVGSFLEQSGYAHRVLRYELYDQQGRLAFTSGKAGVDLGQALPDLTGQPSHGRLA